LQLLVAVKNLDRKFLSLAESQIYSISRKTQKFNFSIFRNSIFKSAIGNVVLPEFAENCSLFPEAEATFQWQVFDFHLVMLQLPVSVKKSGTGSF